MPQQRFYNATDKLINAFIMGELIHEDGCSCAVGNMCGGVDVWLYHVMGESDFQKKGAALLAIKETGYSPIQIFDIEKAFEDRANSLMADTEETRLRLDKHNDFDGFKGLCKVFDYMTSIEDWSEEEKKVNLIEMCLS